MSKNLLDAHRQWRTRPEDERFPDLASLQKYVDGRTEKTSEMGVSIPMLKAVDRTEHNDLYIVANEQPVEMTNWSFGQMATRIGVPAGYIAGLPAKLAVDNINYALSQATNTPNLIHTVSTGDDKPLMARAFTSERYGKILDSTIVTWLCELTATTTWKQPLSNPKGTFGRPGASARPGGLYASDRDLWCFLIDEDKKIEINGEQLSRGFWIQNSEVSYKAFSIKMFLFRHVCGNHILTGVEGIINFSTKHVGSGAEARALYALQRSILTLANQSTQEQTDMIKKSMAYKIDVEDPVQAMVWLHKRGIAKKVAKESVERAILEEGDYKTLWLLIQGLTSTARDMDHADERNALEIQTQNLFRLVS